MIVEKINQWDTAATLWLNGLGGGAMDSIMLWATDLLFVPLAGIAFYLVWKRYSKTKFWLAILLYVLAVVLSDQLCGIWLKELELRVRPCYEAGIEGQLRSVKLWLTGSCGGKIGFPSAHSANAFSLATLTWVLFGKRHKLLGLSCFALAVLIAYSRIYLGVHYLGDVLVGALVGFVSGIIFGNIKKL